MNVVMIGAGYVGLVTGACFAEFGFSVTCIDTDRKKIDKLNNGDIPIYEPGLESIIAQGMRSERLSFTTHFDSIHEADVVMITVGTPSRRTDGQADLSYVFKATEELAAYIKPYTVIVTKSTVPVGTGDRVAQIIATQRPDLVEGKDFDVVSNPEFLREGSAIQDFMKPDRVVIGTQNPKACDIMRRLYRPLFLIETPILFTNRPSAELIKYAANGFLAMKIAFLNQMADICETVNADVQDLAKGIGLDNRIGRKFLNVSPGYGGSCFPKDTKALSQTAVQSGVPCTIIDAVIKANENRKNQLAKRVLRLLTKRNLILTQARIAVLGITFKPNTDDMRDSASLVIIPELLNAGVTLHIYDPLYYKDCERLSYLAQQGIEWIEKVTFAANTHDAILNVDAVLILTEWNEFRGLDLEAIQKLLRPCESHLPLLIDYRNIFKLNDVVGFHYVSLGKNDVVA